MGLNRLRTGCFPLFPFRFMDLGPFLLYLRHFLMDLFLFGRFVLCHLSQFRVQGRHIHRAVHQFLKLHAVHLFVDHQILRHQLQLIPVLGEDLGGLGVSGVDELADGPVDLIGHLFAVVALVAQIPAQEHLA